MRIVQNLFLVMFFSSLVANVFSDKELAFINSKEIERVITLGAGCSTKGAVNAYFCPDISISQTKKGHADLFDWTLIRDYPLLCSALTNKLSDFFEWKDFDWNLFLNKKYNVRWAHLFHNSFNSEYYQFEVGLDKYWPNKDDLKLKITRIKKYFPEIRSKIEHLKKKFLNANSQRTLYIVFESHKGYGILNKVELLNLSIALEQFRENDNFVLLYLSNEKRFDSVLEKNIISIEGYIGKSWDSFNREQWHEILSHFRFSSIIWD